MLVNWKSQKTKQIKASGYITKPIWQQYDWSVGIRTIKGPNKPGHYAILDISEIGKEVVISWSSDEGISDSNPKKGIEHAFDACLKTMKKEHATVLGLTNCLNFGHPKDSMKAFKETVEGLTQRCRKYSIPVVSGNVSLYNAYQDHSIKPTPVIVMVGVRSVS